MSEGKSNECARLHAAYAGFRGKPGRDAYIGMMEAFEADFKADCHAFLPVSAENAERSAKSWMSCFPTPTATANWTRW